MDQILALPVLNGATWADWVPWPGVIGVSVALVVAALLAAAEVAFLGAWAPDTVEGPSSPAGAGVRTGLPRRRVWDTERLGRLVATLRICRGILQAAAAGAAAGWVGARAGVWPAVALALCSGWAGRGLIIAPILAAKRHRRAWVAALTPAAGVLLTVTWPLHAAWHWLERQVAKRFGHPAGDAHLFWTPKELAAIGDQARADTLGSRGGDLFRTLVDFRGTVVREIMVPRTDMVAITKQASMAALRALLLEAGHSRIPVYDETMDNIVGLLHVKDLLAATWRASDEAPAWTALLRPTFWVPEGMKISDLLREFQRRKTHMAICVDEYGGTAGVVTLEDIIEEIVGEIHDEYDVEEKQYRRVGDKVVADGRVSIWDLEEPLGLRFSMDGGFETLAGFLTAQLGTIPEPGMQVRHAGWQFLVKEAGPKRVKLVEITPAR